MVGVFVGLIATIVPIVVEQTTILVEDWDTIVENIQNSDLVAWLNSLGRRRRASSRPSASAATGSPTPTNLGALGGGILAVGAGIAGGFTGATIVLILTLYFLASLASMKRYAARFVPASSRPGFRDGLGGDHRVGRPLRHRAGVASAPSTAC